DKYGAGKGVTGFSIDLPDDQVPLAQLVLDLDIDMPIIFARTDHYVLDRHVQHLVPVGSLNLLDGVRARRQVVGYGHALGVGLNLPGLEAFRAAGDEEDGVFQLLVLIIGIDLGDGDAAENLRVLEGHSFRGLLAVFGINVYLLGIWIGGIISVRR